MLGARVFEKHLTLDRSLQGADHGYALEPKEFTSYVKNIHSSIKSLGTGKKVYLPEEMNGRRRFGAYLSATGAKGTKVSDLPINRIRPRTQVPAILLDLIGNLSLKSIIIRHIIPIGKYIKSTSNCAWQIPKALLIIQDPVY